jgi:O-antigen/teichoic acid export membrane protein
VAFIVGGVVLQRFLPAQMRNTPPVYRNRQWLKSALPFTLIGGAGIINNQADIIMLGWFSSTDEVGIYRVAMQGSVLVAFGLQAANVVVAPHFARLYSQGDRQRLQRLVTQSARMMLFAALPVAVAFIFAGDAIVRWIFGVDYAAAHLPLAILAFAQLVNAGFGSVGFLLNMTGHERIAARILWQTATLNIAMNAVLIPLFGMAGAATASAVSLVVWNAALYRQVRQRLSISSTAFIASSE